MVRINLGANERRLGRRPVVAVARRPTAPGAGPTLALAAELSEEARTARGRLQSSPRAPSAAGSSPRSFSELRVEASRRARSGRRAAAGELPAVPSWKRRRPQRPPIEMKRTEEDDDALAVASLRRSRAASARRHADARTGARSDWSGWRLESGCGRLCARAAPSAPQSFSKMMINGLRRRGGSSATRWCPAGVYTDEDSARDAVASGGPGRLLWQRGSRPRNGSSRRCVTYNSMRKLINWAVHPNFRPSSGGGTT